LSVSFFSSSLVSKLNIVLLFLTKDSKIELREDFDKLKTRYDNLKIETDLLKTNFQELINNCK